MKKFGTAVILCGGKSSRMGFDKSKIKVNGKLMIEFIGEKLEKVFDEILLVAENIDKFHVLKYTVLEDLKKDYGPAGGIYTGLQYAQSENVFFLACDMPIVNTDYIKYMKSILKENNYDGIIPRNKKWVEPLHAFYSKNLIKDFERGIVENNLVLYDIIKNSNIYYVPEDITREFSNDLDIFMNLNYTKDLEILHKIYGIQ